MQSPLIPFLFTTWGPTALDVVVHNILSPDAHHKAQRGAGGHDAASCFILLGLLSGDHIS